jgi:hypothetical protein
MDLAAKINDLVSEYGIADVLLYVLAQCIEGNTNNADIQSGEDGEFVVTCGEEEVRVRPGKDATLLYFGKEWSPAAVDDVIKALMTAACLATREKKA